MITDADIKKLKRVFATKVDLKAMEGRQDKKYATKDDIRKLKTDLLIELSKNRDDIIRQIGDLIDEEFMPLLDHHNKRIHRIEKRLSLRPLSD